MIALLAVARNNLRADGLLMLTNNMGGSNQKLVLLHTETATDGFGSTEGDVNMIPNVPFGSIYIYSEITGHNLRSDARNNSSSTPFLLRCVFNGTVSPPVTNYLKLGFGSTRFEHKLHLTLRKLDAVGMPTTNAWDVFDVVTNQGGVINIGYLSGIYDPSTPYASFQLDFEPVSSNHPPSAQDSAASGNKADSLAGSFIVSDADGDALQVFLSSSPAFGIMSVTNGTNWVYAPHGFAGTNNALFYAEDASGARSGTNTLTLITTNRPPMASAQSVTNVAESPTPVVLSGNDPDGDGIEYAVSDPPLHGNLASSGSNIVYTSANNYYGLDSFEFIVSDGDTTSAVAVVSLSVVALNRLPVLSGIALTGTNVELSAHVQPNRATLPQVANPLGGVWIDLSGFAQSPSWSTNLYVPAVFTIPLGTNAAEFYRLRSFAP